jgi:hypothetical protein
LHERFHLVVECVKGFEEVAYEPEVNQRSAADSATRVNSAPNATAFTAIGSQRLAFRMRSVSRLHHSAALESSPTVSNVRDAFRCLTQSGQVHRSSGTALVCFASSRAVRTCLETL